MHASYFFEIFKKNKSKVALIWNDNEFTYNDLSEKIDETNLLIEKNNIKSGSVVALHGDFSLSSIALLFSLINKACIIVPLTNMPKHSKEKLLKIAKPQFIYKVNDKDEILFENLIKLSNEHYYKLIRNKKHPGLVLFSSGTSGEAKAAVHDFNLLLEKFLSQRKALRTINFLLFDHWGGLNTMFHILSNSGTLVIIRDRSPEIICQLIEKYKVELLPATPTFLNLLLLSEAHNHYDLSSLKIISYGTEPMPQNTLKRLRIAFPDIRLLQTFGLIELGVLRSKSEKNDSLWLKVGGEGYKIRVVDGILQIKAKSAMLGYLNASSPFTKDGWFITGDQVLQKNGYIKILGRKSEIINIGGEKVYPQEVENIILGFDNVADITVFGEQNAIVGNIVCANIVLNKKEDKKIFSSRVKAYCKDKMQKYKIPVRINIIDKNQYSSRYKKKRVK